LHAAAPRGGRGASLATFVAVILAVVAAALVATLGLFGYRAQRDQRLAQLHDKHVLLADQLAVSLSLPIWNFDRAQIAKILDGAFGDRDVVGVVVLPADADARPLARQRAADGEERPVPDAAHVDAELDQLVAREGLWRERRDVTSNGERLGSVTVLATTRFVDAQLRPSLAWLGVATCAFGSLLFVALYGLLWFTVLRPLQDLERYALALGPGGLERPAPTTRRFRGEIEVLRRALASIADENVALLSREKTARLEAERLNRVKDEFLLTLSHELRTPLTAVLGWSELLRRGDLEPEEMAKAVDSIERNARIEAKIVDDILDISRIVTGSLRIEVQAVDLCAVAEAAVDAVRLAARAKGIAIDCDLERPDLLVYGDPVRLRQLVWNLLANAVKFTPRGGDVRLGVRRVGGEAEVRVVDDGIGLAAASLPRVFERFWQADGTTARRYGGLGIGLALVAQIAEAHGGRVAAASEGLGLGATFTVHLPTGGGPPQGAGAALASAASSRSSEKS
jgi:signal transduction histidine kinase